jgi:hypothetical protein
MDLSSNIAMVKFINNLKKSSPNFTTDDFKNIIAKKEDSVYYLNFKEDDNLIMVYYDNLPKGIEAVMSYALENNTRSCILEKDTLKLLTTQFNKIIYNAEAIKFLEKYDWKKVVVEKCYEGTTILVYHHNDKWYVSTRRCLDARESTWVKYKSYREMFDEAITNKFSYDDLNKDYCYYFILLHHKNKNIVNYSYLGDEYIEVIHTMTIEKYTIKEIDYTINDTVLKTEIIKFDSKEDMLKSLCDIDDDNKTKKKITMEGFIIKAYDDEVRSSSFTILKVQTDIYQKLMKLKPNNSNTYQSYMELYQKDKLKEYLVYFNKYSNLIIRRIHLSMRNLSIEILNLYHNTRKKQNEGVYNNLKEQYRKVLYGLHGIYIQMRKHGFQNDIQMETQKSVTIHDVYFYLKSLPVDQLKQLFHERLDLIKEGKIDAYINKDCLFTKTITVLMFPDDAGY